MKKMMVSLMLIISMFAFAAESAPSATVGYVKYSTVATSGTDLNHIAVALTGWTSSNQIDPTGLYYNKISKWNPATQIYQNSSFIGSSWLTPFTISNGDPLVVNMKAGVTSYDLVNAGSVDTKQYSLVVNAATTDLNHIMLPLGKSNLTTAALLGPDIGNTYINKISRWNPATQLYQNSSLIGSTWLTSYTIEIGQHLVVNSINAKTWPDPAAKDDENLQIINWSSDQDPKGGESRPFFILVDDGLGGFFNYPGDEGTSGAKITWYSWFNERPLEFVRWNTVIAPDPSFIDTMGDGRLSAYVDIQQFPTAYAVGNTLNVVIKNETLNVEGKFSFVLNADASPTLVGYDNTYGAGFDYPGVTNDPIHVSIPSSIEESMVPTVTKLYQNYPNPFNPTTSIKFDLATAGNVKLNVYNYNGQLLQSLVKRTMNAGVHSVNFDASSLSAGVYYYTLEAGNSVMSNKMILVK